MLTYLNFYLQGVKTNVSSFQISAKVSAASTDSPSTTSHQSSENTSRHIGTAGSAPATSPTSPRRPPRTRPRRPRRSNTPPPHRLNRSPHTPSQPSKHISPSTVSETQSISDRNLPQTPAWWMRRNGTKGLCPHPPTAAHRTKARARE